MKGIALNELAYLIIAVILVVILLVIFFIFQFPFMVFPIVLFDHLSTLFRGFVIAGIWITFIALAGFFTALIWMSSTCWSPWGAAVCLAENAIIVGLLTYWAFSFTAGIPLVYKNIQLQENNVTVDKHLAEWVVDSSYMTNAGTNDPLRGKSSPIISFIIMIKKGNVNLAHALNKLYWPTYSIYDKMSGKVWDADNVPSGSWWHVEHFNLDILINKTSGVWTMWIENGTTQCEFQTDGYNPPHYWSHPWRLKTTGNGEIAPQKNVFKCDDKKYNVFVSTSLSNSNLLHVTIGSFSLRYSKLKNVVVNMSGKTYVIVNNKKWRGVDRIKNIKLGKGTTIFIDYLDTFDFGSYYADECGGSINNPKEGVYICIPKVK